ncbi:(2Fe-2S)-binding protein [Halioxenophilus sp. WMMB6]|uniref:(2Fe-2S)-binding protein n=1 Tax=Halioxenophilus sp. WMMB6 TaxID=3073815 RepID=UPI00295E82AE|nr:(2Fe-2S)-binding protein [Halioxenophilus sp. WMMB6]
MYVCICKGITDSQIRQAVATTGGNLRAIRNELGAMTQCGKCALQTRDIVRQALAEQVAIIDDDTCYSAA